MDRLEKYRNKIICGDIIEVLKEIPNGSIDLIVTSPPYNIKGTLPITNRKFLPGVIEARCGKCSD